MTINNIIDVFGKNFPSGELASIDVVEVPKQAADFFRHKYRINIDAETYMKNEFEQTFVIDHNNSERTFIATNTISDGGDIKVICLYEMSSENEFVGYSNIKFRHPDLHPFFINKPYIGYTFTNDDFLQEGYGTRRMFEMNALSLALHGFPLTSGTNLKKTIPLWEKLKNFNYVEKKHDTYGTKYKFLTDKEMIPFDELHVQLIQTPSSWDFTQ